MQIVGLQAGAASHNCPVCGWIASEATNEGCPGNWSQLYVVLSRCRSLAWACDITRVELSRAASNLHVLEKLMQPYIPASVMIPEVF